MAATSSLFLTLTPAMHEMDKSSILPAPIDRITLNLAAESLPCNLVPGDRLGPAANGPKAAPVEDNASVGLGNGTPTDEDKTGSHPVDSQSNGTPTDDDKIEPHSVDAIHTGAASAPSVENLLSSPVLANFQNATQDKTVPIPPTEFLSPATILKRRLENTKDLIVCPGVYDGFSARIALSVGFDAMYMVGNLHPRTLVPVF